MVLSQECISAYHRDGILYPLRVMSSKDAAELLAGLESHERETGGPVIGKYRYKCQLVFPWINELMRHDGILNLVEALIGPDIMAWTTHLYPKEPGDGRFILASGLRPLGPG